jgi:hypothetical protein
MNENSSSTRTAVAVAVAACSLTLSVGITTASLLGYLSRGAPEAPAVATPTGVVAGSAPGDSPGVRLVPVRPALEGPPTRHGDGRPEGFRYASLRDHDRDELRDQYGQPRDEHEDDG